MPKENSSIIKVIGVGGGGSNAVNHMYEQGIKGVDFVVVNTDQQALDISPVPTKVQIGASLTEGMGAGSVPEVGKNAAIEDIEEVRTYLEKKTKMVFVTAGMGGGTGTGAAPVIAQAARELGLLTVGIVTLPFMFEGKKRRDQAEQGIKEMRENVDTLLVICNDRLREMYGNLNLSNAFAQADDVLATAAKGIAEVITVTGQINVDFKDVNTVMKNSGVAILGSSTAEGDSRALEAVEKALSSPLLNDNDIAGATYVLLNITYGDKEVLMDEITEITDHIQEEAGSTADVIWGHGYDPTLGEELSVTIIATGFKTSPDTGSELDKQEEENKKNYIPLDADVPTQITSPVEDPVEGKEKQKKNEKEEEEKGEESTSQEDEEPFLKASSSSDEGENESTWHIGDQNEDPRQGKSSGGIPGSSRTTSEESSPVKKYHLDDDENEGPVSQDELRSNEGQEEGPKGDTQAKEQEHSVQNRKAAERMGRIREMTMKLKSPSGVSDLEKEPAYKRKDVQLKDVPRSSETNVSRFTLSEDEEEDKDKRGGIRQNNSFLHDKPD